MSAPWLGSYTQHLAPADGTAVLPPKAAPLDPTNTSYFGKVLGLPGAAAAPLDATRNYLNYVDARNNQAIRAKMNDPRARYASGAENLFGAISSPEGFAEVAPSMFHDAVSAFAKAKPAEARFLTPHSVEEMVGDGTKTFLSADQKTGYAIHPSGDLRNVFNHGVKGNGSRAVQDALKNGATKLDALDTDGGGLSKFYGKAGFKETFRAPYDPAQAPPGWDESVQGRPDYVEMSYSPSPLAAPAVHTRPAVPDWLRSHGVFDRNVPDMQGTVPSDPRIAIPDQARATVHPLIEAMLDSKTVPKGLDGDVAKGLEMGGRSWYNLAPIRGLLEELGGTHYSFEDLQHLGAGSSMQNSVPSEISAASIIGYARKRGLSLEEAKKIFRQESGSDIMPMLTGGHQQVASGGIENGAILPANPAMANWKVPNYADKRLGGGGLLDADAPGGLPAIDTHEKRRLLQLAMDNPRLAKIARQTGVAADDHIPITNAQDYKALGSLYVDGAKRMGLPTSGAYQAGRWTGGWDKTGLKSPPTGDYTQLLEDVLKFTAQRRGIDDSPAGLRDLFKKFANGDAFLNPWMGKGPIPLK